MVFPTALGRGAMVKAPLAPKSLLDRRCIFDNFAGSGLSRSIPSSDGVTPMYQAVGDEGDTFSIILFASSSNIGLG